MITYLILLSSWEKKYRCCKSPIDNINFKRGVVSNQLIFIFTCVAMKRFTCQHPPSTNNLICKKEVKNNIWWKCLILTFIYGSDQQKSCLIGFFRKKSLTLYQSRLMMFCDSVIQQFPILLSLHIIEFVSFYKLSNFVSFLVYRWSMLLLYEK
jgi:hypothetical protein